MKTIYLLSLLTVFFATSCLKTDEVQPIQAITKIKSGASNIVAAPGVVPSDIGLNDIIFHPDKKTWEDLDVFYREVVLSKEHESYFSNLKKMTIWFLVNKFNLLEKADKKTIAYYIKEQTTINMVDADVFAKCLENMKGYWPNMAIKDIGTKQYEKSKAHLISSFGNDFWEKEATKFEKIKDVVKSVPDRWGRY